ncbi:Protein CBG01296 [Caenorhabditis briggsae]|uniref:Protein CBG01296 n=1 Tax=Caenorhabditis briggsae TaxID=6238 RepID=A8WQ27_CAEBR|nr:Protein CBG01296 [Caenorhabditis briggsae]CAP22585.1 Protein CBG01296 [Caenorhabditis briggsae]
MAIETSYLHMRMPPLFVTGILINISALLFSAISTIIFSYFLLSIFCFKTVKKVESLDLFYCHFFYDALFSFTTLLNMIIMLLSQTEAVQFFIDNRNFAFVIVYPVYLTGSMRAIIVLLVEVDRAVATCFPILFYNYRTLIPSILLIALTLAYALVDLYAMFIYCGDSIDVPPGCISIMCALSICYRTYWLTYEKFTYALTMFFSLVLCSRLFFMNQRNDNPSDDLKRANRLALIDIFVIVVFDINPSFVIKFKKVPELSLFYCHFVYDICYNLAIFSNVLIVILSTTDYQFFIDNRNFAFFIIYPVFLVGSMRELLIFFIELDRTFATYFPIIHFKHRKSIPTSLIVSFTVFYAFFDISVMFIYCGDRIDVPPGCTNIVCGLSTCYRSYWKFKKIPEFSLFYFHFVYDVFYSFTMFLNSSIVILSTTDVVQFFIDYHNFSFYIIYPVFLVGAMRALLVLFIEIERTFATYFPIIYFNYRKSIPTLLIVSFTIFYACFDISMMLYICEDPIDVPPGCVSMMCVLPSCYRRYWVNFEKVIHISIIILSLLLCLKLAILKYRKKCIHSDLKRANRLAITDTCIIILFFMTPSSVVSFFPNFYIYVGPVVPFFKTMGMIVEGFVISKNLSRRRTKKPRIVTEAKTAFKSSSTGF